MARWALGMLGREALWQQLTENLENRGGGNLKMVIVGVMGMLMGLSAVATVLSLCARRQVGDRNSDGDGGVEGGSPVTGKKKKKKKKSTTTTKDEVSMGTGEAVQQNQNYIRSPVWQRTILMGERCRKPTFSGLILYDEKGNPLPIIANKASRSVPPQSKL